MPDLWNASAGLLLAFGAVSATPSESEGVVGRCPVLLVVEKGDATVAAFDLAKRSLLWRTPAGEDPHEIEVASDVGRAFVSNYGGPGGSLHMLTVIDLPLGRTLSPVELTPLRSAHGLAARGGSLWFTAESSKAVGRYDLAARRVDWSLGIGQDRSHLLALGQNGLIAVANANSGSVSVIEPTEVVFGSGPPRKDWKITTIATGAGTQGIAITPDGRTLWTMAAKEGRVSVIDLATKQVTARIAIPWKAGNRLKITPDGRLTLIGSEALVAIDTASHVVRTAVIGASRAEGIALDPSGGRAFVALPAENRVAIISLPTLRVEAYLSTGKTPDGLACATIPNR